ncbi:hypothetical protein B0H10DRAFT_500795 [Mycena sp. CBHHK59/15]|nr:hypothetical protein B0H10DRAFT_500795 [Mycena sp. CBHHK59/15]
MRSALLVAALTALASCAAAQSSSASAPAALITHVITVANNKSATNGSAVFTPSVVNASLGETVMFNFTQGNHSATQSTFTSPCIPAHQTNTTINGFNTDLRNAGNGTAVTQYIIIMNPDIVNSTLWFYDQNTCGIGGVGVINAGNVSATWQPYDAFVRNAIRLNGTGATSSAGPIATGSGSGSGSGSDSGSASGSVSTAVRADLAGPVLALIPLVLLGALAVL